MKSVKNLLVPAIVLFAMIVFAVIYFSVESFINNRNTPSESVSDIVVLNLSLNDISSVSVFNKEQNYHSLVVCSSDNAGNYTYEYKGDDFDPKEKYSQDKLSKYVRDLTYYYSNNKISANASYSEYGLDDPRYTITIETKDGNSTSVLLGNISPDGKLIYMTVNGSSDVYGISVSMLSTVESTFINFLDDISVDIDFYDVKSVHFDRKTDGLTLDAHVKNTGSSNPEFEIYSPFEHGTSGYFSNLMDSVANLRVTEFVSTDMNDLSKYGLDKPVYCFSFTKSDATKVELYFSKVVNDCSYGYIKGINRIFVVYERELDGLNLKDIVLIDPYICYCYAKNISSISGSYGDKSFKFELSVTDTDSIVSANSTVTLDGRNAKITDSAGRSYCSLLFESIACIKIGGIEITEKTKPASNAELTLTFLDKNYVTTVYEFYQRDQDSYYVFKNGEYMNFYVYAAEIFNDGGSDTYSYGYWKAYELLNQAITDNINGIYDL